MEGKISIFINADYTKIEVYDVVSGVRFLEVKLTPEQLSSALSRLAYTPCEFNYYGLDKLGKKQEVDRFVFELPADLLKTNDDNLLSNYAETLLRDGWIPDNYFGSQDSFFTKDGKKYARCVIRRWV